MACLMGNLVRLFFQYMKKYILGVGVVFFMFACVPGKRLVYLQHGNELGEERNKDTVLRSYDLKYVPYTLRANDIISLRVASVTKNEYNFINKYQSDLGIIRKLGQYDNGDLSGSQNTSSNILNTGSGGQGNASGVISSLTLDRLNTGFVLDLDGKLNLPEIGELQLSGLTIPEAEDKVTQLMNGYYETPMVRIQLLNFHFTILGEVGNEGRFTSFDPDITVFDAFSIAGNLSEFADRSNIKIIRSDGGTKKEIIYLNTLDEELLAANNLYIHRGDLIIIPPLPARTANRYTVPNFTKTLSFVSAALSLVALLVSLNN